MANRDAEIAKATRDFVDAYDEHVRVRGSALVATTESERHYRRTLRDRAERLFEEMADLARRS